jgi:hypothetical protein
MDQDSAHDPLRWEVGASDMGYDLCARNAAGRRRARNQPYYHANNHWMRVLRAAMAAAGCFPDPDDSDAWRWEDSPCTEACASAGDCEDHCEPYARFLAAAPLTEKLGSNDGWWVTRAQSVRIADRLTKWLSESGEWDTADGTRGELVTQEVWQRLEEVLRLPGQLSPETGQGTFGIQDLAPEDRKYLADFVTFCRQCGEDRRFDGFEVW